MKQIVLGIVLTVLSWSLASANALHLNPDQLATAENMQTFGGTTVPIGYIDYCRRYKSRCKERSRESAVKLTQENWRRLIDINSFVNSAIRPVSDQEYFGVEERWDYPRVAGDCEDYALLKRKILQNYGLPLSALLMTVARDANGGGHAVLTVVTDKGDFVLDNIEPRVLHWREAEIYFLKRQSRTDPNKWESLVRS